MYKVQSPLQFKFMENFESKFDDDNHVLNDYFSVIKLNVNHNISFIDLVQSEIYDLST
jgi:hypothetical protein